MEDVLKHVTGLIADYGYLIVFVLAAGDNFGLPSAGDVALLAGAAAAQANGHLEWHWVVAAALAGALVADHLSYGIGRYGGGPLVRRFIPQRLREPVESRLHDNLGKTVVSARMLAGFRAAVPLMAGVSRVRWLSFAVYNLVAVLIWSLTMGTVGLVFAESLTRAAEYFNAGSRIAAAILILVIVLTVAIVTLRRRGRDRRAREAAEIRDEDLEAMTTRELANLARREMRQHRREILERHLERRRQNGELVDLDDEPR